MNLVAVHRITLSVAAAAAASACAGGSQNAGSVVPNYAPPSSSVRSFSKEILDSLKPPHVAVPHDLFVSDFGASAVKELRNRTYREVGVITSGISFPNDVFLDRLGNLYVANRPARNVTEYAPNTTTPSFTYSSNMDMPVSVTSDVHGNVFEADYTMGLNEYFQGLNSAVRSCSLGGNGAVGVAVDAKGNVFADVFIQPSGPTMLVEFPGGLNNCPETRLGVSISPSAFGIAVDASDNILLADGPQVDVIAPPYTSVTKTIGSGFSVTTSVRLNRLNTLAFVTDFLNATVTVVSYPAGVNQTVLGAANGLTEPFGAVDGPNAVY